MAEIVKDIHQSCTKKAADSTDYFTSVSAVQKHSKRPIWEIIVEIGSQIPDEEWAKFPNDASIHYKHSLYGIPEKNV